VKDDDVRKYLRYASEIAERSTIRTFKTGAVLRIPWQKRGVKWELQNVGWSHTSDLQLAQYRSIHAEMHATIRSGFDLQSRSDPATIFVARIRGRSKKIGLAKPCDLCAVHLFDTGIQHVFYTIEGLETFGYLNLSELVGKRGKP